MQSLYLVFLVFACFSSSTHSANTTSSSSSNAVRPLALHQLVVVNTAGSVLIRLQGYDTSFANTKLIYKLLSAPTSGNLYQLSQVFSSYGYEPKAGVLVNSGPTSSPIPVTGSNSRVYYTRPSPDMAGINSWGSFQFTSNTGLTGARDSYAGTVTLVPPSGNLIGNDFLLDSQGWYITGNKATMGNANFEAFSRGALLNHYIFATDDKINVKGGGGAGAYDSSLWYFEAPAPYLANWGIAYGGSLRFTLGAFSGDFSKQNAPSTHVVELECVTCTGPVGTGITLAFPISALTTGPFNGDAMVFTLPLLEGAGWIKDPQNTLLAWTKPTQCDIIQVLSRLSAFRILGDWTTWYESVALDNVQILNTKGSLPRCAMSRPDASLCTC